MNNLNWKPVRTGNKYCSPACGGGCTWQAKQKAESEAKKLVTKLGPNWVSKVWENLGWWYAAISIDGTMKVHPSTNERGKVISYTAFFGGKGPGGRWMGSSPNPR